MLRPPDTRKAIANHLASQLASPDGEATLRHLRLLSRDGTPDPGPRQPDVGSNSTPRARGLRTIGIWEPSIVHGVTRFVLPPVPCEAATLWADVKAIGPKSSRRRVVLLGESAARGFFLDPRFTPAAALEAFLGGPTGHPAIEVVDLARTDQLLEPMGQLAEAALDLQPDAFVIFAGNNCRTRMHLRAGQLQELAAILEQGGSWPDVRRHLDGLLRDQVADAVARFTAFARHARIPCVWVLPEFNLLDWRTDAEGPALLSPQVTAEWHLLRDAADAALAAGDPARAERFALRLIELDGESTPVGLNLLADTRIACGSLEEARSFLERARDVAVCSPHPESPRCYSVVQQTIHAAAATGAFALVDLAQVFRQQWPHGLPDRRMFYDYCHLTADAIRVSMAATAQVLRQRWQDPDRPWADDLARVRITVDDRTAGEAHCLAAIHNANWGQSADIVRYHCRRAMAASPDVSRIMTLYLEFHTRRTPIGFCRAFEELREWGGSSAVGRLLAPLRPTRIPFLNWKLIDAFRDELRRHDVEATTRLDRLLWREQAVDAREVDILRQSGDSYLQPFDEGHYSYHRAFARRSIFRFVCETPRNLTLTATLRCRQAPSGSLRLSMNGQTLFTGPASTSWSQTSLTIPSGMLRSGANTIEVTWPSPVWNPDVWKKSVSSHLLAGRGADVTPLYGEIHRLAIGGVCPQRHGTAVSVQQSV